MDIRDFESFLEGAGHRVIRTRSASWFDAGKRFFLSIPAHRALLPKREELREVLREGGALGVRFPAPLTAPGRLSYQIVCDNSAYGFESLSSNVRSKVRRGLRRCRVESVSFQVLSELGRTADRDTRARQGRSGSSSEAHWHRYWESAARARCMEGWAAWVGDELAAYLVTVRFEDSVEFLLARSRSDRLDHYPNNALIFEVARLMLTERKVAQITFGLESLEEVDSLEEFKMGMGFTRRPVRQCVVFREPLGTLLSIGPVRAVIHRLGASSRPSRTFWRKALGLLRFAEETSYVGAEG